MPENLENREAQENSRVEQPASEVVGLEVERPDAEKLVALEEKDREMVARELPRLHQEIEGAFGEKEKRKSSVTRVVGKMEESQRSALSENQQKNFKGQDAFKANQVEGHGHLAHTNEREKTPEELEIISIANDVTNEVLEKFGLEKFDVPVENLHMLNKNLGMRFLEVLYGKARIGGFSQNMESTEIKESVSKIDLLHHSIHEMIHAKSYNARQMTTDGDPESSNYRVGLETRSRDGEDIYFQGLNEAVTEELTKRIMQKAVEAPVFKDEKARTEMLKNGILESLFGVNSSEDPFKKIKNKDVYYKGFTKSREFGYKRDREDLQVLTRQIYSENQDRFKNPDEVFDVFVKAMMTGNILDIGRLIEGSRGKGSLRSVAERRARVK